MSKAAIKPRDFYARMFWTPTPLGYLAFLVLRAACRFVFRANNDSLKAILGAVLITRPEMEQTPKTLLNA